uniref:Ras and Rab interactor 2a n=1 Tax=Scleropages formosus TaxID=113540 RepID=A0A8C9VA21_SCLFO
LRPHSCYSEAHNLSLRPLQLIDRLNLEVQDLKQEMVQMNQPFDSTSTQGAGYSSKLTRTQSVWLQLSLGDEEATRILQAQPPGTFMVRSSRKLMKKVVSLRMEDAAQEPVQDFPVQETKNNPVLEKAMHKCVLKPLKGTVLTALQEFQEKSGEWQQLKANLVQAKSKTPQELGADPAAAAPDPVTVEKIRHKFHTMFKMYSPEKKVSILLQICKIIYTIMEGSSGRRRCADDFLPMLTYVLAQCDLPQLDLEIQYMMELLDPSQLQGEGGYYLTSAYAAMSLIRSIQEEQAEQVLRSQTRDTLKQWHRRRTAQRSTPVIEDLQNYLRVALQDPDCSCTAKTLQVPPFCTTRDVCQLCASKFQVRDPESHALFLLTEGGAQQLEPDTLPQMIKAEIHSHPDVLPFHFVYRPLDNLNLRE